MNFSNGNTITGMWLDDKLHGIARKYYNETGTEFIGTFSNDLRHGPGVVTFESGDSFHGTFVHGSIKGAGIKKSVNLIQDGLWHGHEPVYALKKYGDSGVYQGTYDKQGLRHGFGKYQFADGSVYSGEFEHGYPTNKEIDLNDLRSDSSRPATDQIMRLLQSSKESMTAKLHSRDDHDIDSYLELISLKSGSGIDLPLSLP